MLMARGAWLLSSQPVGSPGPAGVQGWRHRSGALKLTRCFLVVARPEDAGVSGDSGRK